MASRAEYGETTTAAEIAQAFSLAIQGKTILITGVSPKSLGESLALSIASQRPALLILASRTQSKIDAVTIQINDTFPDVRTKSVLVDLSSQNSVRKAAEHVNSTVQKIDILVNNAGIMDPDHHFTPEGVELQFGTNHIGPFLFTNLLMPKILAAAEQSPKPGSTRIVNVTSAGHRISPIRFSDYNFEGKDMPPEEQPPPNLPASFFKPGSTYSGFLSYGQSKTANILMSVYLTEHLRSQGIVSYSVHPGSIWTDLSRHLDEETTATIAKTGHTWKSQDQGAATMMVAAFNPALRKSSGVYLSDCQIAEPAGHASDSKAADRLWHLSEKLVGQTFDLDKGR